jgi:VWFA-related protein
LIYSIRYDTYDPSADHGSVSKPIRLPGILGKLPFPTIGGSSRGGGPGSTREEYDLGQQYLEDLAAMTGGRVYEADKDLRTLKIAFSNIAQELGQQYSVGYYPQQKGRTGERRQIRIRVDRDDVAVRARDGYVYKGP